MTLHPTADQASDSYADPRAPGVEVEPDPRITARYLLEKIVSLTSECASWFALTQERHQQVLALEARVADLTQQLSAAERERLRLVQESSPDASTAG